MKDKHYKFAMQRQHKRNKRYITIVFKKKHPTYYNLTTSYPLCIYSDLGHKACVRIGADEMPF